MTNPITLTGEEWKELAERLNMTAALFGKMMEKLMMQNQVPVDDLQTCCDEYQADICLAVNAMLYVSEFAADKVQIQVID